MVRTKPRTESRSQAHAEPTERRGIPSAYLLLALGLVVFVVSMPRFRAQVVRDNTLGARDMLLLVGEVAAERGHRDVVALLAEEASLRHRLRDARPAATVGRMRLHGYLLDDVTLSDGAPALAAWPLDYGRTGSDAWLCVDGEHIYRHSNGGRWTGEARPLRRVDLADGWQPARVPVGPRFP
jgi:hypothetical protein